jgi:hypothetical protein
MSSSTNSGYGRWRDGPIKTHFVYLFPMLLTTWVVLSLFRVTGFLKRSGPAGKALIALAAVLSLIPFSGLSLADYLLSLSPSFSIGSIALFTVILWKELGGRPLLSQRDFLLFCLWNIVLSLLLFASTLGFMDTDLYALGYHFSVLFAVICLLTILLAFLRSPLAFIFVAYIAAFDIGLLPSPDFFDYMTDPILFIGSLVAVVYYFFNRNVACNRSSYEYGHRPKR